MKAWLQKARKYLEISLGQVPQELNELDWKESLSPNNNKLCKHISAFANHPGGGFLVFGIDNSTGKALGVNKHEADIIIEKLSSLCRDSVEPFVRMDHAIESFNDVHVLIIYICESAIKPVYLKGGTIENCYIRSGNASRKASRQRNSQICITCGNFCIS